MPSKRKSKARNTKRLTLAPKKSDRIPRHHTTHFHRLPCSYIPLGPPSGHCTGHRRLRTHLLHVSHHYPYPLCSLFSDHLSSYPCCPFLLFLTSCLRSSSYPQPSTLHSSAPYVLAHVCFTTPHPCTCSGSTHNQVCSIALYK